MKKQRFMQMIIMVLCAVLFACAGFAMSKFLEREGAVTAHATGVASTIYWKYDNSTKTLTLGSNEFTDGTNRGSFNGNDELNYSTMPWYSYSGSIISVNIETKITPGSVAYWFYGCTNLNAVNNISNLDTSQTVAMYQMFGGCSSLTTVDVSKFDTSKVERMYAMFMGCSSLQTIDVSGFDTSQVENCSNLFNGCAQLKNIDVSGFKLSNDAKIVRMFSGCSSLECLDLSGFQCSNSVYDEMFNGCNALEKLRLSDTLAENISTCGGSNMPSMYYQDGTLCTGEGQVSKGGGYFKTKHTHVWDNNKVVVVNPTCLVDGSKTYPCTETYCSEKKVEAIPSDGHSFTNYVYNNDATCMADGTETATCDNCTATDTRTKTSSMLPHVQGAHHDAVAATCSQTGNVEYWECANGCGCNLNSTNQAVSSVTIPVNTNAHSFTNYVSNDNATCTDNATETASCDHGCGQTDTREILGTATGHKWATAWSKDATNHWHVCENSGCTAKGGETAHVYNWVTDTPATLTTTGIQHEECLCGAKRNEGTVIPIQTCAHAHLTHHDRVEATCVATGNIEYWHCDDCNKNLDSVNTEIPDITIPIDNTAHVFTNYVSDNNATCTADGTKTAQCDHGCGATDTVTDTGSMTQHTYEWEITKQPTEDEEGEKREKCTVCGHIGATETIAKLIKDPGGNGNVSDLPPDKDYDLEIAVKESDNLYTVPGINKGFKVELYEVDGDNKVEYDKDKEVTLTLMIPEEMKDSFTLYVRRGDVLEPVSAEEYTVDGLALSIRTKLPNEFVFNAPAPEEPAAGIPWWVWLIVGLAGAAVIGVVIVIIVVAKKKSAAAVVADNGEVLGRLDKQDEKLNEIREIVDGGFNDIVDDD